MSPPFLHSWASNSGFPLIIQYWSDPSELLYNKLNSPALVIASNNPDVNLSFNFLNPKTKQNKMAYVE